MPFALIRVSGPDTDAALHASALRMIKHTCRGGACTDTWVVLVWLANPGLAPAAQAHVSGTFVYGCMSIWARGAGMVSLEEYMYWHKAGNMV